MHQLKIVSILLPIVCCASRKAGNLTILTLIPYTGYEPRNGRLCTEAIRLVTNEVNARDDILPRFHINLQFENEDSSAGKNGVIKPLIRFSELAPDPSSLVIGPVFSDNCRKVASVIHHLNLVAIGIGCSAPMLTANRRLYPSFYRSSMSSELVVNARRFFIQHLGKWTKIAILTSARGIYDYTLSAMTQQAVLERDINVVWFDVVTNVTASLMNSLQSSDARVIVFDINSILHVQVFLCEAYKAGIRGERFVFFMQTLSYFDPIIVPESDLPCDKRIFIEQFQRIFFIGIIIQATENKGPSSLGYDLNGFEAKLDLQTGRDRSPDFFDRHRCHDTALQAMLALDKADRNLLSSFNLTLADFQRFPMLVSNLVNRSVAETDFLSLRVGRSKFSGRLEMDSEPIEIAQWSLKQGYHTVLTALNLQKVVSSNQVNFEMRPVGSIDWGSSNGDPPRDAPLNRRETLSLSVVLQIFLIVSAVPVAAIILALTGFLAKVWHFASYPACRIVNLLGAMLLNFASVLLNQSPCVMASVFMVVGLSLNTGVIFGWAMLPIVRERASIHSLTFYRVKFASEKSQQIFILIFPAVFAAISVSSVVSDQLIYNHPTSTLPIVAAEAVYDQGSDTVIHRSYDTCYFQRQQASKLSFGAYLVVLALATLIVLWRSTVRAVAAAIPNLREVSEALGVDLLLFLFFYTTRMVMESPLDREAATAVECQVLSLISSFVLNRSYVRDHLRRQ